MASGAKLVVAAGGDGTINEVAEGLIGSQLPLGILPSGTANCLANEVGLSTNLETAARALLAYLPERVSVGRLRFVDRPGARHFVLMAGVGVDARIIYDLSAPLKTIIGKGAYWLGGLSILGRRLEEFVVEIGDRTYSCSFALVSKVRNYGGDLQIARDTSLFDDQFEVVLFAGQSSVRYLQYFAGVIFNRLQGMKGVTILRARELTFVPVRSRRVDVQVDGEHAGHLPGTVEVVEDSLTLLLPSTYRGRIAATARRPLTPR